MGDFEIQYSPESVEDLGNIYHYIANNLSAPDTAVSQIRRIQTGIRSLSIFPKRFRVVEWEPWQSKEVRQLVVDNFIVFYIVIEPIVNIVRIFYGGRDIKGLISFSDKNS